MDEYISKAKIIRHIRNEHGTWGEEYGANQIVWDIDRFTAADVAPVRRGKWEDTLFGWLCTNCREEQQYAKRLKFCPNCGAKMEVTE